MKSMNIFLKILDIQSLSKAIKYQTALTQIGYLLRQYNNNAKKQDT